MALSPQQVNLAFQNALGRAPNETEVAAFSNSGLTDVATITAISNSQEANLNADPVVRYYQAAFNRVPDKGGLDNATDFVRSFTPTVTTLQSLAAQFTTSQEFVNTYGPGQTVDAQFVQKLYANVLGRTGSQAEVNAYVSGSNGYDTRAEVFYAFSNSPEFIQRSDSAVNEFLFNAASGVEDYTGPLIPSAVIPPVTNDDFVLTSASGEIVTGTAGDDIFTAVRGGSIFTEQGTLNVGDRINGLGGNDTLNLFVEPTLGGSTGLPGSARIENVETINLFQSEGATFDATTIDAGDFINSVTINQIGQAVNIDGLQDGQTAGFIDIDNQDTDDLGEGEDASIDLAVTVGFEGETASIAFDGVNGDDTTITLIADDAETLNVSGSLNDGATLILDTAVGAGFALSSLTTINLDLTSDTEFQLTERSITALLDTVETIDGSGSTGDLVLDLDSNLIGVDELASLSAILTGSGSDAVTLDLTNFDENEVTVSLGDGGDLLTFASTDQAQAGAGATRVSIELGDGLDTVSFVDLANLTGLTRGAIQNSLITIEDFDAGDDSLEFAVEVDLVTGIQQNQISRAETLADAVNVVNGITAEGAITAFNFGNNAYIFSNGDDTPAEMNPALPVSDGLVELVGVSRTELQQINFGLSAQV